MALSRCSAATRLAARAVARAAAARRDLLHVSQFDPSIRKYRPDWDAKEMESLKQRMRERGTKKDGHYVEAFRVATQFNQ